MRVVQRKYLEASVTILARRAFFPRLASVDAAGCDQWPRWAETQGGVKDLLTSCERQATGGSERLERHRNWARAVGVFVCIRMLWVGHPADSLNVTTTSVIRHGKPDRDLINICQSDTWSHIRVESSNCESYERSTKEMAACSVNVKMWGFV